MGLYLLLLAFDDFAEVKALLFRESWAGWDVNGDECFQIVLV